MGVELDQPCNKKKHTMAPGLDGRLKGLIAFYNNSDQNIYHRAILDAQHKQMVVYTDDWSELIAGHA